MVSEYHDLVHAIAHILGVHFTADSPSWLHPIVHIVLFWGPATLSLFLVITIARRLRLRILRPRVSEQPKKLQDFPNLARSPYSFILVNSKLDQITLVFFGVIAMPILYLTLEVPKLIINDAIESGHFPFEKFGITFYQETYLFALSFLFLIVILVNGAMKFSLNLYKGKVGERLLRRLRLIIYRHWRLGAGAERRSEIIPVVTQEVEPIGGFAADAFALPVFQGGTFLTIVVFMFVQDPILGAAALALLPIQLAVIPKLQSKVNTLARERVAEIRSLGGELGDQAAERIGQSVGSRRVGQSLKRVESIRVKVYKAKFLMKAINNFLNALTPFFFYSIGGYLVIEGELSLGALVAVLAAYKDFSSPLKELFRFYQTSEDVRIRYREVIRYLTNVHDIGSVDNPSAAIEHK